MIASLHVATGAAAGALVGSPRRALALGPVLHLAADLVPHEDIGSHRFETATAVAALLALAALRGPFDPATLGGAAAAAPDVEHVVRLPRPRGRKLFPTHRGAGRHTPLGLPTWVQLLAAGTLLGLLFPAARLAPLAGARPRFSRWNR
ncbi:MAG: hypothetical protein M3168_04575 [Actinomycetota bacterium]|nr:hypothetical protein [Actinomycetota bacterium]